MPIYDWIHQEFSQGLASQSTQLLSPEKQSSTPTLMEVRWQLRRLRLPLLGESVAYITNNLSDGDREEIVRMDEEARRYEKTLEIQRLRRREKKKVIEKEKKKEDDYEEQNEIPKKKHKKKKESENKENDDKLKDNKDVNGENNEEGEENDKKEKEKHKKKGRHHHKHHGHKHKHHHKIHERILTGEVEEENFEDDLDKLFM
jgi:hypothetical protein